MPSVRECCLGHPEHSGQHHGSAKSPSFLLNSPPQYGAESYRGSLVLKLISDRTSISAPEPPNSRTQQCALQFAENAGCFEPTRHSYARGDSEHRKDVPTQYSTTMA